jgi:hypothetical protein
MGQRATLVLGDGGGEADVVEMALSIKESEQRG